MKMMCVTILLVALSFTAAHDVGKTGSLRGQNTKKEGDPDNGSVAGHYFGLNFDGSPFGGKNPWVTGKSSQIIEDMDPTAPYDALDKHIIPSWTGSAPVSPGSNWDATGRTGFTHTDFVPPYLHPKPFPQETETYDADGIAIPIENRLTLVRADRLRVPGSMPEIPFINPQPLEGYPLVAPADKLNPGVYPVAHLDAVPNEYDKFFDQTAGREAARKRAKKLAEDYGRVDTDDDNAISTAEYDEELQGHQKKTSQQAGILWNQYKVDGGPDMNQAEFQALAKNGYDLGGRFMKRDDLAGVLLSPQAADLGFWGGGMACPEGSFIKGVQIKVQPYSSANDNTALNSVKFRCQDGSVIKTAEGPNGAWTKWAECPDGQTITSLSIRVQPYRAGQDNSGINDMMFQCRSKSQDKATTLKFGDATLPQAEQKGYVFVNGQYVSKSSTTVDDKAVVVGAGKVAIEGGWSEEMTCGMNGSLCGAQGRLYDVADGKDNMGVTDFRFFCCSKALKCSAPCKTPTSTACKACQATLKVSKGR